VSPAELASLALEALVRVDGRLNAVAEAYLEVPDALAAPPRDALAAHLPDALSAHPPDDGPFAGVPFLFKDAGTPEAGRRQEFGSRLLLGRTVAEEGFLAARFRRAGLVSVGRSNVPEFTLSLSTESLLHGPTRNPWDTSRHAGGSSGGAAAAVAAGIVPLAHATDTAGSIRIPASACGLVGLKPSRGRVTHGPQAGEPFLGMDVEFALSRSVRDSAALLDAVSGPAPGDPFVIAPPARRYREEVGAPVERLRLAVTTSAWGGYPVDPEVASGTMMVARELERMGHEVEEAAPELDYDAFIEAALTGWALGFDLALERYGRELGRPIDGSTIEPVTMLLYRQAKELDAGAVARAEETFNTVRRGFGRFFERYDALITPTLLRKPEPIGKYSQGAPHDDFESFFRLCDESGAFLPVFNLTGQPAISLPLLWSAEGLPMGVQFVARFGEEGLLLRLAGVLEESFPWRQRRPRVHAARQMDYEDRQPQEER
jgi:amidase